MTTLELPTTATVTWPHSYGAAFDDLLVRLAPGPSRPVVTELAPAQAPRMQTSSAPEELMPEFGDVHSMTSWSGGEGLFDRWRRNGTDQDGSRFWSSEHLDVSPSTAGLRDELRLLTKAELIEPLGAGTLRLATASTAAWVTSGTVLRYTADVTTPEPSWVDVDPHDEEAATPVLDVATLGSTPYAALGAGGVHRDVGSGWAHWSDVEAERVWSAVGRIVASDGPSLYEADAADGSVLLYTLPPGETWNDVAAAGVAIIAAASSGTVYAFRPDEAGDLTVVAQAELEAETPVALRSRGELVFIATSDATGARLWFAESAALEGLQLLRQWDGASVERLSMGRDRLVIGLTEGNGAAWTWQLELSTLGLSKARELGAGAIQGLTTVDGKLLATVAGVGVWRETDELYGSGWLIGPMADFFRAEPKSWMTAWLEAEVDQGQEVTLWYTTDRAAMSNPGHPSWRRVHTYRSSASGSERPLGAGLVSRTLALMVRLEAASGSPTVRAMAVRAYPGPGDVIVRIPVDVGDQVERHGRRRLLAQGWGARVMDALREYEHRGVRLELFRSGEVIRGMVENIATPEPWHGPRGSTTYVSMVTVRGRRVEETYGDVNGWGAWGNGAWGSMSWGGEPLDELEA